MLGKASDIKTEMLFVSVKNGSGFIKDEIERTLSVIAYRKSEGIGSDSQVRYLNENLEYTTIQQRINGWLAAKGNEIDVLDIKITSISLLEHNVLIIYKEAEHNA